MKKSLEEYLIEIKNTKALKVNLSPYKLDYIPNEVFKFTWIEELYLGNCLKFKENEFEMGSPCKLKEIPTNILHLKRLKRLSLNGGLFGSPKCEIEDFSILGKLTSLESLYIGSSKLKDISFIKTLTNLKDLQIGCTEIVDFQPLKDVSKLESLGLSDHELNDLSFLSKTTKLKAINLASNNLHSLSTLNQNKDLERICVCYNKSVNLNELANNHRSLKDICNTSGYTIELIEPLVDLQRIVLSENITNKEILRLNLHKDLKELTLSNVNDKSIDVSGLTNLQELDLSGEFEEVIGLRRLLQLKKLKLSSDVLKKVDVPINLKELAIMECKFDDLRRIKNINNLDSLCLSVTEVTDLTPLKGANQLKSLDIQFNQITTIEPILGLIKDGLEIEFDKTDVPVEVLYMYEEGKIDEIIDYYKMNN